MTDTEIPEIVSSLEDDSGERMVDILYHVVEGHFTYVEYHRASVETDEWRQVKDDSSKTYKTQFAAYTAATRKVEWMMD
ncbi:MAG: hypothetical protein ACI9RO_000781 [Alteromonas macleodii]|jgi:uncharacterized surface protein with fasciclin (FAS1) repeats